jgi:hypothetical protein
MNGALHSARWKSWQGLLDTRDSSRRPDQAHHGCRAGPEMREDAQVWTAGVSLVG